MTRATCGRWPWADRLPLPFGFPVDADRAASSVDTTDGEIAELRLFVSMGGGAAGNLKSIGGGCGLRTGPRDGSLGRIGLGAPDLARWFTSTRRLFGERLVGESRDG